MAANERHGEFAGGNRHIYVQTGRGVGDNTRDDPDDLLALDDVRQAVGVFAVIGYEIADGKSRRSLVSNGAVVCVISSFHHTGDGRNDVRINLLL